jgi:diguanylate cyclase (GGDEF)-like protein
MAKLLRDSFRKDDLIVRNGGEEFCVILDNIDKEKSIKVFEELRYKIEKTPFEAEGLNLNITVSIGLFYGLKDNIDEMLNHADELLYTAKHEGRNRLVND